ncbi:MAG: hypothetical protein QM731_01870 [Chitinophagaceae bacterium]
MRAVILTSIAICTFLACKKDHSGIIETGPEPRPTKVTSDTLTSGSWRDFTIGQTTDQVYLKIQNFPSETYAPYLGIIKNIYTEVTQLENKIPLYNQLLLDETIGTGTGIQVTFQNDKVSSIYTNNGTSLSRWPSGVNINAAIVINDDVSAIYQKLTNINAGPFNNKLQRMSLFSKNVMKSYDPAMAAAPSWEFSTITGGKHYVIVLNFSAGILTSMYVNLIEPL